MVLPQYHQHLFPVFFICDYTAIGAFMQKVKKTICSVTVVSRIRKEAELAVQKYDCVARFEEILGGGCTSGTSTEIVDKPNSLFF